MRQSQLSKWLLRCDHCAGVFLWIRDQVSKSKQPQRAIDIRSRLNIEDGATCVGRVEIEIGRCGGHEFVPHFRPKWENEPPIPIEVTEF